MTSRLRMSPGSATLAAMFANLLQPPPSPAANADLLSSLLWWLAVVWFAAIGGCLGSFFNVVWDRWGTGRGIVVPRSRCADCGRPIRWYHNVPVIGWLVLGGRCRDCGAKIPIKHPLVEGAFAVVFAVLGMWLIRSWF